jgi:outer membrane protein OmpA-like peptidoglycan-associated protein
MRNKPTSLATLVAILVVPIAAAAQTGPVAPPAAPWPPTDAPTYPAPAPAPAPVYPAPAPAPVYPTPGPAPVYPTPTPTPTPVPAPNYWNAAPPAPAPAAPTAAPGPAPAPSLPPPAPAPALAAPIAAPVPLAPDLLPDALPASTKVEVKKPEASAPAPKALASETDERPRGFIPQLSLGGSVGLLRMGAADVGGVGQLRLSLHGEYFTGSSFLVQDDVGGRGDRDTRLQGALTFGITPIEYLEIFGAVLGSANRNRRLCSTVNGQETCTYEPNHTDPELIKSFGDLILGAKVASLLGPGFSGGAELGIRMMSSISGISFSPDSTSLWLNAIGTYDLKPATQNVPLRFHLNLGYYVDNSSNLVDYSTNNTSAFSRYVSKFAYGISGSRMRVALGADAPFDEVAEGFSLRPMLEYHFEYLTSSKDDVIYNQEHLTCGQTGQASCKDNKDLHWLTFGVQAQVLHGLTLTAGLDVALKSPGYPYAPALVPWNFLFGIGYPIDLVPRIIRNVPVEKIVNRESAMHEGLVAGRVISAAGTPVEGAVVGASGREHSRVLTEADGTFQSVPLAAGPIELLVVANGFESATVRTEIIAGQTANIVLRLTPKAAAARAVGRVSDETGKGIVASIKLAGPQIAEGRSDESGNFSVPVVAGLYAVRVDADQYLSKELQATVTDGRENAISITLRSRPAVAGVTFQDGKFKLRQALSFKSAGKKPTADLGPGAQRQLDEVVDILANHSEIHQLRVEAHWDSSLKAEQAQSLTDSQAKAVAKYLVDQGIAADRVVPVGMAAKKPLVPNLGAGKVKNRRIELVVVN